MNLVFAKVKFLLIEDLIVFNFVTTYQLNYCLLPIRNIFASSFLAIALLLCSSIQVLGQCTADAGPNVTTCSGVGVAIGGNPTAVNPNPGVTYSWTPVTGLTTPTDANPIANPAVTTTYTVTLNGGGPCNGQTDQVVVTVQPSPNANFTFAPNNTPCANVPIAFTNTTTACPSCQYSWNFGDGTQTISQQSPTHTFNSAVGSGTQNFTVTLTVTSANGCTSSSSTVVAIKRIPQVDLTDPISSFTNCNGDPTFAMTVFDAGSTAGNTNYTIVWGDATANYSSATAPSGVAHTYIGNSVFNLVYSVTGSNGCTASQSYTVSNITNPSIGAANPGGTQGCGPLNICFPLNNFESNHATTTYVVDFGDGSPTQLINHPPPTSICHTYTGSSCATNPSGYTFSITATNNCDQSVATIFPVKVYSAPVANFTANPVPACVNANVTFTNTSTAGYNTSCSQSGTYTWTFGDGSPSITVATLASQSHSYSAPGNYTVTLVAMNGCGTSTATQIICVEPAPNPVFTVNSNLGCLPMAVTTSNTSTSPNSCSTITAWIVDYVDLPCAPNTGTYSFTGGTSASSLNPQFSLTSVGTYTIRLRMTNACGVFEDTEVITVNTVPVVTVTTPNSVCVGTGGVPTGTVNGCNLPITAYNWTFAGGVPASASTLIAPTVTYTASGNFNATLQATNACGSSSAIGVMNVLPAPNVQISASDVDNIICNGQATTLTAIGAGTYTWSPGTYLSNYGSNNATVQTNPTNTVTYTVTGTSGSCTDTETITLTIDPLPTVAPSGTFAMCAGQTLPLSLNVAGGSGVYSSYLWAPNTNLTSNIIANPVTNTPTSTSYSVQVTDNHGCIGTGTVPVTVNPLPNTNAGLDINLCNQPVPTQLTGFSPTTGGTGPGGSGTWSGTNVTNTGVFTPGGVGCVTLTYCFTNATTGCMACDTRQVCVTAPVAANAGQDTTICMGVAPIQLPAGSWTGSPNISATGLYTPIGPMVDDVIVTQGNGSCATSDTTIVTVLPLPVANAGADVTICAGAGVTLTGICTTCPNGPASFCTWTGGPSAPAQSCSPTTGPLNVTTTYNLTIVDVAGCTGSDQKTVFVNPLPATNAGADMAVCNQPIATQLTGLPAGGTWSGTAVTSGGSFTPTGSGVFPLVYCYTNPATLCAKCDTLTMTVANAVAANAGPDFSLCQNSPSLNLPTPTPGGIWSGPVGTPITSSGFFTPSTVASYTIVYSLGAGTCVTTDTVVVTVRPLPNVELGNNVTICVDDTTQLNAVINGGTAPYNTSWNFGTWLSSTSIINPLAFPPTNTTFTATVTDVYSCVGTDQITVLVNGLPIVEAGNNISVCNQPIAEVLTGFSANTSGTGFWYGSGITNSTGEFTSPGVGTYWLYYEFTAGGNACSATDSIQVTVIPPVITNAGPDLTFCQNVGQYQLTGYNPPAGGTWSGTGVIDAAAGIIQTEVAGVGTWTVTISNGAGTCHTQDQMTLTIHPLPVMNSGPGAVVCGNANIFNMPGFSPATGGTWEGPGITNAALGTFDPAIGAGMHDVFYWYVSPVNGCSDTVATTVNVSPVPVANFTVPVLGCTNAPVGIVNLSSGATLYTWNFGNADTTTGTQPVYTYPAPAQGIFNITMIASNAFGCADTASNANEIINPPLASLTVNPAQGCAPLNVTFDNFSVGLFTSYNWNLSTTTSTDSLPPAVTYLQGDDVVIYPISLTASNFCGSTTDNDQITVLPQPIAGFGTNLDSDCSPFEVMFNNTSTGLPDVYAWNFGDGATSGLQEPVVHIYYADTIPVDYTIYLYLSNQCGLDTAEYTITVLPNTVTAFFNTNVTSGCEPLTVEFTNYSDGATQISYNLDDNTLTGNDNPTHTYNVGDYTIMQFADNGCSYDTTQVTIHVLDSPNIDFSTNVINTCTHNNIQFLPVIDNSVEFEWDFGDGTTSDISNPTHEYITGGNYVVTFTTSNNNLCTATVSHPFTVFNGPEASFNAPNQLGCSPFNICFSNTTTAGSFYSWDFGNGSSANTLNACYTYENFSSSAQLYTVTMVVQDMQLCSDTATMDIIVAPQPVSAFTLSGFESCFFPQQVMATNFSQLANGYTWYVNGTQMPGLMNTAFLFSNVGTYAVDLVASNQFGCTSTSTSQYVIHPLPDLSFSADSYSGCVPLTVNFTNESIGSTNYVWLFGDGASSIYPNAQHTYGTHGFYDVQLVGYTDQGCFDTLSMYDLIKAYRLPIADFHFDPEETTIYEPEIGFFDESSYANFWEWNFGDGGTATTQNAAHTYAKAGEWNVTLTVWTNFGCKSVANDVVIVNDIFNVFVPNTFTPDGDDINEVFLPKLTGLDFIEHYRFEIFDRWGTTIFTTKDPLQAWTGDVRNGEYFAKDDAYNWLIKVQLKGSDKERVYNGHVLLVR